MYDFCLSNIYSYYNGDTRDSALLKQLKDTMKVCKDSFFPNDVYSPQHNFLGRMALISPRLYYEVLHLKRWMTGPARWDADR